jgi:hypothetical protein
MLAAWLPYRESIMAEWKAEKRKGLPWVEAYLKERKII